MERRKFLQSSALAATIPLTHSVSSSEFHQNETKELYELRSYEMKFRGNANTLIDYLQQVLKPALEALGVNHFLLMNELGKSDPRKIWVLISYPDASIYLKAQQLNSDVAFMEAAKAYNSLPQEQTLYNRYESSLLLAFGGMPQMMALGTDNNLLELRIYEGYSEDAVRRKIKMFDVEEIALFNKVGLYPVFFGDMIAGPYRPALTYMLQFKDMEERDANWQKFLAHPDWKKMLANEEYANTVSNIRRLFLTPF